MIRTCASRINSTGYLSDVCGRRTGAPGHSYTWDGASRLRDLDGVDLRYNGLGQLIERTVNGNKTRYHHNHAQGLRPIVGEQDAGTGDFRRYYVWTPGGSLLYMIDAQAGNKVYYYHFDRAGSTLALTDSSGNVTDTYAYAPYGRLLAHLGQQDQPFTFIGRWGVRQEGSAGRHYQMRARYYDALTARFLSREPLWPRLRDPRLLNPYQYALNNPVGLMDVTGTAPEGNHHVVREGDPFAEMMHLIVATALAPMAAYLVPNLARVRARQRSNLQRARMDPPQIELIPAPVRDPLLGMGTSIRKWEGLQPGAKFSEVKIELPNDPEGPPFMLEFIFHSIHLIFQENFGIPQYISAAERGRVTKVRCALSEIRKKQLAYETVYGNWE